MMSHAYTTLWFHHYYITLAVIVFSYESLLILGSLCYYV